MGHHGTCEAWAALAISAGLSDPVTFTASVFMTKAAVRSAIDDVYKTIANPKLKREYELILFIIHMLKNIMCNTWEKW